MPPPPPPTASCVASSCRGDKDTGFCSSQLAWDDPDELLCCEDIQGPDFSEAVGRGSDLEDDDEHDEEEEEEDVTALLVEAECNLNTGQPFSGQLQSKTPGLCPSVEWILRVRAYYHFQPVTAYLAVSYMGRFLRTRSLVQEEPTGWPMQLLSVACLSLAAKMEETVVPSLIDLQVEGARFVFEQSTISRMELLVLGALNWRLQSLTPFHLIGTFARKSAHSAAAGGTAANLCRRLATRASYIVLGCMQEDADLLEFYPSVVAATAVVLASGAVPGMESVDQETALTWWPDMDRDQMASCHRVMGEQLQGRENSRLLLSQQQQQQLSDSEPAAATGVPTSATTHMSAGACSCTTISSSSTSISSSPYSPNKRRRLGNGQWVKDDDS